MKLKEMMTHNVETISAKANLMEAAHKMARLDIGFLPVVDDNISGVLTDRDIVVRAIAEGRNPLETKVADILTSDVQVISEDADIEEVAKLMEQKKVRRILVKDDRDAYVGVVSLGDVAVQGHKVKLCGEAMEKVCQE